MPDRKPVIRGPARRLVPWLVYGPATLLGLAAFGLPVLAPRTIDPSPVVLIGLAGLAAAALVFEASSDGLGPRAVAALGMLTAINSVLRFAEVAFPGPGGFSPIFVLVILAGAAFGARFGFLLGALTIAVSGLITGGIGPWLPYQMLAAGWTGVGAGWIGRWVGESRFELPTLVGYGAIAGLGYGVLMTTWSFGFLESAMPADPDTDRLVRFAGFYLASSLVWDLFRSAGNVLLLALAGQPILVALRRFGLRFGFERLGAGERLGARERLEGGERLGGKQLAPSRSGHETSADGHETPVKTPVKAPESTSRGRGPAAGMGRPVPLTPGQWLLWALGVAAIASVTRNVALLALLWLCAEAVRANQPASGHGLPVTRIGLLSVALSAAYGVALIHSGGTVLLELPATLPLVGGPWTLEGLVAGLAPGLVIAALLSTFAGLGATLGAGELARLAPARFEAVGLVTVIALTYVPVTLRQLTAIREARRIRGATETGVRELPSLAIPLLVGSLERAMTLAESVAARGLSPEAAGLMPRLVLGGGLALVAAGAATAVASPLTAAGILVALVGLAGIGWALAGGEQRRTRLTEPHAGPLGLVAALAPWLTVALWVASEPVQRVLTATPFTGPLWPALTPAAVGAVVLVALPVAALLAQPPASRGTSGEARGLADRRPDQSSGQQLRSRDRLESGQPLPSSGGAGLEADGRAHTPSDTGDRTPVAAFDRFGFRYPSAAEPALEDITVALGADVTLVSGPSGSGKSTLLRSLIGLVPHFTGGRVSGSLTVLGLDPVALGPTGMVGSVAFVGGDPETGFIMDNVTDEVAFGLEQRGLEPGAMRQRVAWALAAVGLPHKADASIDALSGGERQRVAIASALASGAPLLVLDEPTSQLDDDAAEAVLEVVHQLVRAGQSAVVSEHRLDRVLPWASGHFRLEQGSIAETEPPSRASSRSGTGSSDNVGLGPGTLVAATFEPAPARPWIDRSSSPDPPAAPVLSVADLSFAYGDDRVLDAFDLCLRQGEVVVVSGPSGSGKTTLLRLIMGLLRPDRGAIQVAGKAVSFGDLSRTARQIAYLPQNPSDLLYRESVLAEVRQTLANFHLSPDGAHEPMALLRELGIEDLGDRYPRDLSTGERQRAALAAVIAPRQPLWLLDEPTRGLDNGAIESLAALLRRAANSGVGVIVASHDRRLWPVASRQITLRISPSAFAGSASAA